MGLVFNSEFKSSEKRLKENSVNSPNSTTCLFVVTSGFSFSTVDLYKIQLACIKF